MVLNKKGLILIGCLFLSSCAHKALINNNQMAWQGNAYSNNSKSQQIDAAKLINDLPKEGITSILDVGCGSGNVTKMLALKYPKAKIVAIDPDESMIKAAKEKLAKYNNVEINLGNAQSFKHKEKFDLITAFHVMHWISKNEQDKALKNFNAHLKKNGHLALLLAPSKEGLPFSKALSLTTSKDKYQPLLKDFSNPQHFYKVDEYRKLLEKAGFFVEDIGYFYNEKKYETKAILKNWLIMWLPQYKFLHKKDPEIANEFAEDLINTFLNVSRQNSKDPISWGEYVMIAKGRANLP